MTNRESYEKATRQLNRMEKKGEITEAAAKQYRQMVYEHYARAETLRAQYEAGQRRNA